MIDPGCRALIIGASPELSGNVGRLVWVVRYVQRGDVLGQCRGEDVVAPHEGWLCEFVGHKGSVEVHGLSSAIRPSRFTLCREADLMRADLPRGRRPRRRRYRIEESHD